MTYKDLNLFIVIVLIIALALFAYFCITYYRTRAVGNEQDTLSVAGGVVLYTGGGQAACLGPGVAAGPYC